MLKLLRFIDITLGLALIGFIFFFGLFRSQLQGLFFKPRDYAILFSMFLFLGGSAALIDLLTPKPHVVTVSSSGLLLDEEGGFFGIYFDVTGTSEVTHIDWGSIKIAKDPVTVNVTKQIWIKNEDDSPIILSMNTESWYPVEAEQYLTLSWDFGDTPLYPSMSRLTTLTLEISPDITGIEDFSFNIRIIS